MQAPSRPIEATDVAVVELPQSSPPVEDVPVVRTRLLSLDAFRGLTIVMMLLVNNVALDTATPATLKHGEWTGVVTLADIVFPWFLLCVGIALPFAYSSFRRKDGTNLQFDLKAVGRALALLFLGCLIESALNKRPTFALGVLQLIGLAYLVAAILYPLRATWRLGIAAGLLIFYGWALRNVPVPGVGLAFEEGSNIVQHINQTYLKPFGLSGLPSVLPTAALVLIGTLVGDLVREMRWSWQRKSLWLAIGGATLAGLGFLASGFIPYNKPVWTPSYILLCAGLGTLAFLAFYLVIDQAGWKWLAMPLVVFGANAILAYVMPILVKVMILQEWSPPAPGKGKNMQEAWLHSMVENFGRWQGGWLYTISYILVWWVILAILYKKKVFLRV